MSKVFQIITDQIINSLNQGNIPWRKPWVSQVPTSLNSCKSYRGINHLLLSNVSDSPTQLYLTYNQCKALGKQVIKGAKSLPVVYHMFKENKETGEDEYKGARFYKVFSIEDTSLTKAELEPLVTDDVLERLKHEKPTGIIDTEIESFLACMLSKTNLKFKSSNKAYYMPSTHTLAMPPLDLFKTHEEFYATYFHELIHSTMDHCKRDAKGYKFGSHKYSFEELVAEIGAQFLCDHFQIRNSTVENSQAYIESWLKKFKGDSNMVIKASSKAQQAVDYLLTLASDVPF